MAILLWLFSLIISILILHWIIINAINSSELARDIKEIKEILKNQDLDKTKGKINRTEISIQDNTSDIEDSVQEKCPACGNQVLLTDKMCDSCGLTLIIDDEKNQ